MENGHEEGCPWDLVGLLRRRRQRPPLQSFRPRLPGRTDLQAPHRLRSRPPRPTSIGVHHRPSGTTMATHGEGVGSPGPRGDQLQFLRRLFSRIGITNLPWRWWSRADRRLLRARRHRDFPSPVVPADELFVMGDNGNDSGDSRIFGRISGKAVIGKAAPSGGPSGTCTGSTRTGGTKHAAMLCACRRAL